MSEPYLGEIRIFAGNFAPRNWAQCDGALLSISQYQALFSILGTTYGGDGRTTFSLPDLRARAPMHEGQGTGLSSRSLGQKVGSDAATISVAEMPSHSHVVYASANQGTQDPTNGYLAEGPANFYLSSTTNSKAMHAETILSTGNGDDHENRQPYLALNFIIALVGLFPPRN